MRALSRRALAVRSGLGAGARPVRVGGVARGQGSEARIPSLLLLHPAADRLAARQLVAGDVVNALRDQNVQVAAGQPDLGPSANGRGPDSRLDNLLHLFGRRRRGDRFAGFACLWWVAHNCWDVSIYVGDARSRVLPLLGR